MAINLVIPIRDLEELKRLLLSLERMDPESQRHFAAFIELIKQAIAQGERDLATARAHI